MDGSLGYFSGGPRNGDRMFGIRPGLGNPVCPKFDVVGDGVHSSYGYLVRGGGAGVDGELAEAVDLPDLFLLGDAKPPGNDLEFVADYFVDLLFRVGAVSPAFCHFAGLGMVGGFVDGGEDLVVDGLGDLFLQVFSGGGCGASQPRRVGSRDDFFARSLFEDRGSPHGAYEGGTG